MVTGQHREPSPQKRLAERVRDRRAELGLTQNDLAKRRTPAGWWSPALVSCRIIKVRHNTEPASRIGVSVRWRRVDVAAHACKNWSGVRGLVTSRSHEARSSASVIAAYLIAESGSVLDDGETQKGSHPLRHEGHEYHDPCEERPIVLHPELQHQPVVPRQAHCGMVVDFVVQLVPEWGHAGEQHIHHYDPGGDCNRPASTD